MGNIHPASVSVLFYGRIKFQVTNPAIPDFPIDPQYRP